MKRWWVGPEHRRNDGDVLSFVDFHAQHQQPKRKSMEKKREARITGSHWMGPSSEGVDSFSEKFGQLDYVLYNELNCDLVQGLAMIDCLLAELDSLHRNMESQVKQTFELLKAALAKREQAVMCEILNKRKALEGDLRGKRERVLELTGAVSKAYIKQHKVPKAVIERAKAFRETYWDIWFSQNEVFFRNRFSEFGTKMLLASFEDFGSLPSTFKDEGSVQMPMPIGRDNTDIGHIKEIQASSDEGSIIEQSQPGSDSKVGETTDPNTKAQQYCNSNSRAYHRQATPLLSTSDDSEDSNSNPAPGEYHYARPKNPPLNEEFIYSHAQLAKILQMKKSKEAASTHRVY
eukprot:Nk52_evm51s1073 gene=Nk52_evmTU51s1073